MFSIVYIRMPAISKEHACGGHSLHFTYGESYLSKWSTTWGAHKMRDDSKIIVGSPLSPCEKKPFFWKKRPCIHSLRSLKKVVFGGKSFFFFLETRFKVSKLLCNNYILELYQYTCKTYDNNRSQRTREWFFYCFWR